MNTIIGAEISSPAHQKQLLDDLVSDHTTALLAYAEKLLSDRHTAQDIVQETLIRAWPHTERLYSTEGSVRGWLLTVARNLIVDRMRSACVRRESVGIDNRDVVLPDHSESVLLSVETNSLLRQLSHHHREVLVLTYLCGRTIEETARILRIPAGTVKSRQYYALSALRARVASRDPATTS
ncbi:sigma-70 family RNA polymerase sigma factor [Streptomyces sp. NBC_00878]|uniref:sigma-70 family RNA polymerase sigma factor n=1 Tax=Streptomyces sp. NBC_00878 TaxID=2975854 RepID=UPI0022506C46|nr:sigma-70 family RNA polymerase sigma factor [Streptomyces sp. NBC_00878]MCX4902842.1 sigma-70 family RNA polymerase sigma factor [Streptomyces sp. NBC_00878]